MEIEEKFFGVDDDPEDLLHELCGNIFHMTKVSSFESIKTSGAILSNKNGSAFGLDNTGTSNNSLSIVKGFISLFDLREKHPVNDKEWIEKWVYEKYYIFGKPHLQTFEDESLTRFEIAYIVLSPDYCDQVIGYHDQDQIGCDPLSLHCIPRSECWIPNRIPLEWISK